MRGSRTYRDSSAEATGRPASVEPPRDPGLGDDVDGAGACRPGRRESAELPEPRRDTGRGAGRRGPAAAASVRSAGPGVALDEETLRMLGCDLGSDCLDETLEWEDELTEADE